MITNYIGGFEPCSSAVLDASREIPRTYIFLSLSMYIYIYIYRERERDREIAVIINILLYYYNTIRLSSTPRARSPAWRPAIIANSIS